MRVYICFPLGSSFGIDYSILHMILFWELFHERESGATSQGPVVVISNILCLGLGTIRPKGTIRFVMNLVLISKSNKGRKVASHSTKRKASFASSPMRNHKLLQVSGLEQ